MIIHGISIMNKSCNAKSKLPIFFALLLGLSGFQAEAAFNINLEGYVDLDAPKAPNDPYLVQARLTGDTFLSASTVYGPRQGSWSSEFALVAFTIRNNRCTQPGSSNFVSSIPGAPGKYGFKLDFTDTSGTGNRMDAWIIPSIAFNVTFKGPDSGMEEFPGLKRSYSGKFFTDNSSGGLRDSLTRDWNVCFIPIGVSNRGSDEKLTKEIRFSAPEPFELYTTGTLSPGRFSLTRKVYVGTFGTTSLADRTSDVQFVTNIKVVRICKIKNVSQSNFNITLGRNNQEVVNSSFQYTCTADSKPIYISAIAREGRVDSSNKNKLWFDNTDGTSAKSPPWLLALPYKDGEDQSLTCADERKSNLLRFDNAEQELSPMSVSNKDENLNIKWSVCSNDNVTPGKYRARVEVIVYTKV